MHYDSHGENYAVDAPLHLAMNPATETHPQPPSLLSFAQDLLISGLSYTVFVSACMCTHMYVLHTALSISSAECIYSFFTSEIPLIVYSVERTCGYPAPLESLGGNSISCFFFFLFFRCSPISGCLQSSVTAIPDNVIVHLQQT